MIYSCEVWSYGSQRTNVARGIQCLFELPVVDLVRFFSADGASSFDEGSSFSVEIVNGHRGREDWVA